MSSEVDERAPEIRAAIAALLALRSCWIEAVALDLRLTHAESRIAIAAVAKYLNKDPTRARFGTFWPSVRSLMRDLNAGERTIQRALQQAKKFGYFRLVEPGGGKHNTAVYRPTLPEKTASLAAIVSGVNPATSGTVSGANLVTSGTVSGANPVTSGTVSGANPVTSGAKPRHQRHLTLEEDSGQGESASRSLRASTRDPTAPPAQTWLPLQIDGKETGTTQPAEEHVDGSGPEQKRKSRIATVSMRPARRVPIPADWWPDEQDRRYAASKGYDEAWINDQAERFRDYHLAVASLFAEWHAAWRTWVQRAPDFDRNRGNRHVEGHPTTAAGKVGFGQDPELVRTKRRESLAAAAMARKMAD